MDISFKPLIQDHFPFLIKWLEVPHVKKFWDQDITHTIESVTKKYGGYINNDKIRAYVIYLTDKPIG